MSERSEDAWIAGAAQRFAPSADVVLGIGHDAAALRLAPDGVAVVAKDVLVDGVHFDLAACGGAAAARKSLAVNLSDLAAAASVPAGFLIGVVLPHPADRALFDALADGFEDASRAFRCPCLGGDTNVADGPLVLSVTVLGAPGPMGVVSRTGAQPGDVLSVTGPLGGSRSGRHLTFTPRLREAAVLARLGIPKAMMDLSDGLARDLPRLCRASGIGARIDADLLPVHADVRDSPDALEHALGDGEDFELLVAHAPLQDDIRTTLDEEGVSLHAIGAATDEGDLRLLQKDGTSAWPDGGWDHIGLR